MKSLQWYYWSNQAADWLPISPDEAAVRFDVNVLILAAERPAGFPPAVLKNFYRKLAVAFGI